VTRIELGAASLDVDTADDVQRLMSRDPL
jgi:hypothetical protein